MGQLSPTLSIRFGSPTLQVPTLFPQSLIPGPTLLLISPYSPHQFSINFGSIWARRLGPICACASYEKDAGSRRPDRTTRPPPPPPRAHHRRTSPVATPPSPCSNTKPHRPQWRDVSRTPNPKPAPSSHLHLTAAALASTMALPPVALPITAASTRPQLTPRRCT